MYQPCLVSYLGLNNFHVVASGLRLQNRNVVAAGNDTCLVGYVRFLDSHVVQAWSRKESSDADLHLRIIILIQSGCVIQSFCF